MIQLLVILFAIMVIYFLRRDTKPDRLSHRGKMTRYKLVEKGERAYMVQEFKFKTYMKAHAEYFKMVNEIEEGREIKESKCDLYDWSFNFIRYEAFTIGIKYYRSYHCIQIAKSLHPVSIEEMDEDNPFFVYP